jgi:hypothetical protein
MFCGSGMDGVSYRKQREVQRDWTGWKPREEPREPLQGTEADEGTQLQLQSVDIRLGDIVVSEVRHGEEDGDDSKNRYRTTFSDDSHHDGNVDHNYRCSDNHSCGKIPRNIALPGMSSAFLEGEEKRKWRKR